MTREEWVASTRDVSLLPQSPIEQKDGKWTVVQRMEAWIALGPRIFDEHLDRFREIAVEVLRERDPQFELEPDQRYAANVHDKVLEHSGQLRSGLAETLALMSCFPDALTSCTHGKARATALIAVKEIFVDADWVLWASVNPHLPMLAEAAPDEFLDAVANAAAQIPSPFVELYAQESCGITGRNYMTGLLWGLETLAWHSDYITRVIVLLGELAEIDPGGNWANRPGNSITEILLPWHPQTCADIPKRKTAITTLLNEHPALGWKLLLSLLPKAHGVASGTHKAKWRPLTTPGCRERVADKGQYWEQVNIYAQLAIEVAASDSLKLAELIKHLPNLPGPAHTRLLELLVEDTTTTLPDCERRLLWENLISLAGDHRKFADADWALPPEAVAKIEGVASKLAPKSPSFLYARLFTDCDFDLFEQEGNYEEQRRAIATKRQEAVTEIAAVSGVEGLVDFAKSVTSPWQAGFAVGVVGNAAIEAAMMPSHLVDPDDRIERFAAGFVWGRFHAAGWGWVDGLETRDWTPSQKGVLLTRLPFDRETWVRADRLLGGDQSPFWTRTSANPYEVKEEDLILATELLLKHGRTRPALRCLNRLTEGNQAISGELVICALQANLRSEEPVNTRDQHAAIELIKWLQDRPDIDDEKLLQIEWNYLPMIGGYSGGSPRTLTRRLSQDAGFFCEVIRAVFRSKKEEERNEELPKRECFFRKIVQKLLWWKKQREVKEQSAEERKRTAENAYRLLSDWRVPPGCTEQGEFDEIAFKEWLSEVKRSTQVSGHFEVAMSQLGQVLPYSPPDPNGIWINKAVADALNSKDAESMRSGFTCELFNMRGTHGFTEGKEEMGIAAAYDQKAEAVESAGYHRLATSIRELAASYKHDAERDARRGPFGG